MPVSNFGMASEGNEPTCQSVFGLSNASSPIVVQFLVSIWLQVREGGILPTATVSGGLGRGGAVVEASASGGLGRDDAAAGASRGCGAALMALRSGTKSGKARNAAPIKKTRSPADELSNLMPRSSSFVAWPPSFDRNISQSPASVKSPPAVMSARI